MEISNFSIKIQLKKKKKILILFKILTTNNFFRNYSFERRKIQNRSTSSLLK